MEKLAKELERLKEHFDNVEQEREKAYSTMRELRRMSVKLVRDIQRDQADDFERVIGECRELALQLSGAKYPFGFIEEALQEYSEAALVYAFVHNQSAPTAVELGCTERSYLTGFSDAISELRRRILVLMRKDDLDGASAMFDLMDKLFSMLMIFDHTDAVLPLRRKQDALRAVVERTRADLTSIICQKRLEDKLAVFKATE